LPTCGIVLHNDSIKDCIGLNSSRILDDETKKKPTNIFIPMYSRREM
jgi:hypothetical protein